MAAAPCLPRAAARRLGGVEPALLTAYLDRLGVAGPDADRLGLDWLGLDWLGLHPPGPDRPSPHLPGRHPERGGSAGADRAADAWAARDAADGVGARLSGLVRLHRAHVARIAYTSFDIWRGLPPPLDPVQSVRRICAGGRAGYCFHLNGAFAELLAALGYQVRRHVAGVQLHRDAHSPGADASHLALTVHGLPARQCPEGTWLVDVGLGDGPHDPLPLRAGVYRQGPFEYRLRRSEVVPGGWRFEHDPAGSFRAMDIEPEVAELSAFVERHRELSTAAGSGFVRTFTASHRHASGADVLTGLTLRSTGAGACVRTIGSQDDWYGTLDSRFGITVPDLSAAERSALWARVLADHEAWVRSRSADGHSQDPAVPGSGGDNRQPEQARSPQSDR